MKWTLFVAALAGFSATPAALADGCCGPAPAHAGCGMAPASPARAAAKAPEFRAGLKAPVQGVFDNYLRIQRELAQDSLKGIDQAAAGIAAAVRGDASKALPARVAEQADALARARDLAGARSAFKLLSDSLIAFQRAQHPSAGAYHVAYCPMAKASWLQTGKTVVNPYMGKEMLHCGEIKS